MKAFSMFTWQPYPVLELAFSFIGNLPEPKFTHEFF